MDMNRIESLARTAAAALLALGCLLVLRPFIGAILFAGILCLSTWPAFVLLRERMPKATRSLKGFFAKRATNRAPCCESATASSGPKKQPIEGFSGVCRGHEGAPY